MGNFFFNKVDFNICISTWQNRTFFENKAYLIHNGIELKRFDPAFSGEDLRYKLDIKEHQIVVGLIARITPIKGHADFIRAAQIVAQERDNFLLIIVGEARGNVNKIFMSQLRKTVDEMGLAKKIDF